MHRQDHNLLFFPSEKQFRSNYLRIYCLVILDQNDFSLHVLVRWRGNKLTAYERCVVSLQCRQRFHPPSISLLLLKSRARDHEVDLEISKASLNVFARVEEKLHYSSGKPNAVCRKEISLVRLLSSGSSSVGGMLTYLLCVTCCTTVFTE